MSLVDLLIFIMSSAGLTVILVLSVIMEPLRAFLFSRIAFTEKLLSCPMCTGFWMGFGLSFMFGLNPVLAGAITSVVSWFVSSAVEAMDSVSMYVDSYIENGENNERID
tara:strand:- start:3291 stop:3617 length:327 start_codon:yes stop_codon:yes gene_type:complete